MQNIKKHCSVFLRQIEKEKAVSFLALVCSFDDFLDFLQNAEPAMKIFLKIFAGILQETIAALVGKYADDAFLLKEGEKLIYMALQCFFNAVGFCGQAIVLKCI